jgi:hydroxymethylglutaryl-CoA reductase
MIDGYHKLTRDQQLQQLHLASDVALSALTTLPVDAIRQQQIENYLTDFSLPEGIAVNLLVNGQEYVVPMVTEEPSVIAAASNGAKIISRAGGFQAISRRLMIGQLLLETNEIEAVIQEVENQRDTLIVVANAAHPSMQKRGGGAVDLKVRRLSDHQLSLDLLVDTREAMGANTINAMVEAVKIELENQGLEIDMAILSNLADQAVTTVTCQLPVALLSREVSEKIVRASEYAQIDPYRATTHNKGIMNGIDAVVMATGNDWRAIESGAHAYAARDGQYRGLSTWQLVDDTLIGRLEIPLSVATVGGSIGINQRAQLNLKLMQIKSAKQLAEVIGAVGLAQNLAALRAIVAEGIQKGHMRLQAKSLLIEHGVETKNLSRAVEQLMHAPRIDATHAKKIIEELRKKDSNE